MLNVVENQITKFINDNIIINRKILSNAFNMQCEKITLNNDDVFVAKYYIQAYANFNSILSEAHSLIYLTNKFPKLFPSIKYYSENLLIIDFIEHNNIKNKDYQEKLAIEISRIHNINSDKYGFSFDAQIGGLKQSNNFDSNWINFFREKRLNMIFEKINNTNPMPRDINKKIEKLLINLDNYLPKNPRASLLHGDLWSGNILYHNGELAGLIDPGIYFGHNELEIAYLTWFKFIDNNFFRKNILI